MNTISSFEQLKTLGHPLRLAILRHLMAQPATLSQLGASFNQSPAHIRHHVKVLELAGLIEFTTAPLLQNHLEKYYQAVSAAWLIRMAVLPAAPIAQTTLTLGSKDVATRQLASYFREKELGIALQILPLNSLDGLVMLQQGVCQMATCHLREPGSGEYNRPYIQHLFVGQRMALMRLFLREEGLIVQPGNPKQIRSLEDLARPDVVMINRERGAGIRVWLDQNLAQKGIDPQNIQGYSSLAESHVAVAQSVRQAKADVGFGIAACARQAELEFIPLFEEPYELVLPCDLLTDPRYTVFFEHLNSSAFREAIRQQEGYLVPPSAGQVTTIL
jgi:putative molybdopterin biosynthesis protein